MKVLVSVFNNLLTDQRIEKVCQTLHNNHYEVELIGNNWRGLPEMKRPYRFNRILLKSKILKFAYLEFQWKLYRELLKRADQHTILLANDLDTLLTNYWVSKKLHIPLVFDSHEIFTEMPSVNGRFTQKIWRLLERSIVPKLKYFYTSSESYANWFAKNYDIKKPIVVQNFPRKLPFFEKKENENTPKTILYQGVINPSRGIDKAIEAMQFVENTQLLIAGDGPKLTDYQQLPSKFGVENKVVFLGNIPPEKLREITRNADLGLSIEENNGLSYYYSLPNKISDYIQSRIPIVVSDFPEFRRIIDTFQIGECITSHEPSVLAQTMQQVLDRGRDCYAKNAEIAAEKLCWEQEEGKLLTLYQLVQTENFV